MNEQEKWIVPEEQGGQRLDKALEAVLSGSGLRLRRRLCDDGRVLVDGRAMKPGYKVSAGQCVILLGGEKAVLPEDLGLMVVERHGGFLAVYKPGEVHSAVIAGRDVPSVEALLPSMLPGEAPVLLNRLDFLTSGLLLVALTEDAVRVWRDAEESGNIRKFYVAEVEGRFDGVTTVRNKLDTADRKITRILDETDGDPRRWTDVQVLSHDWGRNTSMVTCLIVKGARHQIRAHLASIGHPIIGDSIYGAGREGDALHLHHRRVELPGFTAEVSAPF
ncbi:pseudouridine synthase [Pseudodesulfovibrio sp.]|uniref:pseudouridine synthase n=1 Tax=unclassified Pseudodesulfovibrio TaxID=2661612 RepID=UPI003AFF8655